MGGFDWYNLVVLPSLIFGARVLDVSLGTVRIILTTRGKRNLAPLLGFAEVFLWVVVISQLVTRSRTLVAFLGYAGGFAVGNFIGIYIEEWLATGHVIVRVILQEGGERLFEALREAKCGVTVFNGFGSRGPVKLIFTLARRKDLSKVVGIIHRAVPGAFFSVGDVRTAQAGIFPSRIGQKERG
ncbi:MAG: DUF2179 domain-containing protein [Candidatus Caldatribacteriaceae bacterium]